MSPSMAVRRKLDEVLMIETRVVEVARVRALVNKVHIIALKRRLRMKNSCAESC